MHLPDPRAAASRVKSTPDRPGWKAEKILMVYLEMELEISWSLLDQFSGQDMEEARNGHWGDG
jgi:hypothetical protein